VELALVVVIALLVLLAAIVAVLARQDALPVRAAPLRALADLGARAGQRARVTAREAAPFGAESAAQVSPYSAAARGRSTSLSAATAPTAASHLDQARAEALLARLDRIERRLDDLTRDFDRRGGELSAELRRAVAAWSAHAETDHARRESALERLRGDLLSASTGAVAPALPAANDRRTEVCADLYAKLARLEVSLAAVTNPVLLPGERYAPPEEFTAESLVWENWNEVGERVFALADAYSAQRLHLSVQTRDEVGTFVTTLRTLLTRSIYPNLQPEADRAQQTALRTALEAIAAELPQARAILEREYGEDRGC
jgi:hypothetical protein